MVGSNSHSPAQVAKKTLHKRFGVRSAWCVKDWSTGGTIFSIYQPDPQKSDRCANSHGCKISKPVRARLRVLFALGGQPVSDELHVSAPLARAAQRAIETLEVQPFPKRVLPGLAIEALVLGRPRSYCVTAGKTCLSFVELS